MGIVDEDIARVRDATDIVELVSKHVGLRRVGQRWVGLCPFHDEKSPSFSVNAKDGFYHCFGCKASGDVITFVRETEHLDFVEAVERLAAKAGITLRYTSRDEGVRRDRRKQLIEAVDAAVEFYHRRLLESPDAGEARAYLRSRGFDGDEVRRLRLGWAPDDWDLLARHLRLSDDDLVASGLGLINRRGRQQDWFRGRVLFPIADVNGDPIGFGGRLLPGRDGPKYINSADCAVYHKSRVLYALDRAKAAIVAHQPAEVVICEGYTDVIAFERIGMGRAVATCGTALTDEHVNVLKRFAGRFVLAFDADEAGQSAAERFYAWEQAHGIDVVVADLPPGVDPGDLAQRDPERLRASVEAATPFLEFRLNRLLGALPLDSPEHRARAAEWAVAVVAEHPSELVRDQYLMTVADRCRVDIATLRHLAESPPVQPGGGRADRRGRDEEPASVPARRVTATIEDEALRVLVAHPDEVAGVLRPVLFASRAHRGAAEALLAGGGLHEAMASADPEAAEVLGEAAVSEPTADPEGVVSRLVDVAATRALRSLEVEARAADDARPYVEAVTWLHARIEDLRERTTRKKALDQLLPWLDEHGEGRVDD